MKVFVNGTITMRQFALITTLVGVALVAAPVSAQQPQRPAQIVRVAAVQITEIAPTVAVPGTVFSRNEAEVTAGVSGLLTLVAEPGDVVKKGDPVAAIDPSTLTLRRAEQVALLARGNIEVRKLENELRRQKELSSTNVISEFQLEQTEANRDLAVADTRIIGVRIRQIDDEIRRATTLAPFDGIIVERTRRPGEEVSRGATLARMTDIGTLEVRAFVPLKHLQRTHVGDSLNIFNNVSRVQGEIRALIPTGDVRSQTFEALIDLPASALEVLTVGQLVSVAIPIRAREASLAVPRDALVLRNEGSYVYRINPDNTAERVPVTIGDSEGDLVAVGGELEPGDNVAIRGGETLSDGASVQVTDT